MSSEREEELHTQFRNEDRSDDNEEAHNYRWGYWVGYADRFDLGYPTKRYLENIWPGVITDPKNSAIQGYDDGWAEADEEIELS